MPKLIELKDLCKEFNNDGVVTKVLHSISFNIEQGEFVAIMGRSGSGKSTLMNVLGFLDKPSCGEYHFKNKNIKDLEDDEMAEIRNSQVGFIFQSFNLLPRTTVFENVQLPLMYSTVPVNEHKKRIEDAIALVGLSERRDYLSNQLSGGEKQRVAIARALVNKPSIIFADEPTGNLDSKTAGIIMTTLQKLDKQGITIILVTHEEDTAQHAERMIKLQDGVVVSDEKITNRIYTDEGAGIKK
ncbi:ABC transporter ATP-binding protein [Candidatus Falkowbacteria bacterium]|jgi:putative ABC transport system ATP-binding protein|nr:ABC transporter ATP-binding protein [Candidatus Falkowbacteria bacterium]MBT7007638.1 ABC transporter ATP-binding protein [Candidatus Falkowbacteria bacterium]